MSPTKTKRRPKPKGRSRAPRSANGAAPVTGEVLTLAEAAEYLRVPAADVLAMLPGGIPGRRIGSEWRFLKSALQEWLRTPGIKQNKESLMSLAGICKDDPTLDEMVKEIYRQRGRPMTEDEA